MVRSPTECGQLGDSPVGVTPATLAHRFLPAQTGRFALQKGSATAIAASLSAVASTATLGMGGSRGTLPVAVKWISISLTTSERLNFSGEPLATIANVY